jgi:HEAT repeat protein
VPAGTHWELTPRESIEAECARRGRDAVVAGCVALIEGTSVDTDPGLLLALAGPAARKFLDGTDHDDLYWLRVWGTRGLLWAWRDQATGALLVALGDEHWRVREMAAKVAARHLVGDALEPLTALRDDPVPRVRAAAERAVAVLTSAGA